MVGHAEESRVGDREDCSIPPIVINNSSNDEIGVSMNCRRVMPSNWVKSRAISLQLCGRDDSEAEVGQCVQRCKGIICIREATKGRAGLPVKDRVLVAFSVSERIGESIEEGDKLGNPWICKRFSRMDMRVLGLFGQGSKLFIGSWWFGDIVSFVVKGKRIG